MISPKHISIILCSFIAGVGVGSVFVVPASTFVIAVLGTSFLAMLVLLFWKNPAQILLCIILGLSFGFWYVDQSFSGNEYESLIGQQIDVEGVVAGDPVNGSGATGKGQQLTLLPDGLTQYLRASLYTAIPDIKQGDRVWIRGQVELPNNFSGFDYVSYLQRYQVYAELKKPKVIVLARAPTSWRAPLLATRNYINSKAKLFPEQEGSLIVGILIGQQGNIPDDVKTAFKRTGLTHIVAVSGFNMTIIVVAFGALVWYLGRRLTNLLIITVVFGFVVITGATASVVRAAIMAVLMVVAQLLGRQYTSLYALLIVCAIMVLQNPRIVMWDIGFQLSVAATFGVLIAFKIRAVKVANGTASETKHGFLADMLRPTLGAIAVTAPIIAIQFQTFSVIALVANMVVLPFVSWIMLFGALALLPIVGGAFVYPAQLLATAVIYLTEKFASVPYASINLNLPLWAWGAYYLVLFLYIFSATKTSTGISAKPQLPNSSKSDKL